MARKRGKQRGNKKALHQAALRSKIISFYYKNPKKRLHPKQLAKKLKLPNNVDSVRDAMLKMAAKGQLYQLEDGRFKLDREAIGNKDGGHFKSYDGFVDLTRSGAAYIVCDDLEEDIFGPTKRSCGCLTWGSSESNGPAFQTKKEGR